VENGATTLNAGVARRLQSMHVGIPWTDEMIAMAWEHLRDSAVQLFKLRI
jgi:hypothetical protein